MFRKHFRYPRATATTGSVDRFLARCTQVECVCLRDIHTPRHLRLLPETSGKSKVFRCQHTRCYFSIFFCSFLYLLVCELLLRATFETLRMLARVYFLVWFIYYRINVNGNWSKWNGEMAPWIMQNGTTLIWYLRRLMGTTQMYLGSSIFVYLTGKSRKTATCQNA